MSILQEWADDLARQGRAPATIKGYLKHARAFERDVPFVAATAEQITSHMDQIAARAGADHIGGRASALRSLFNWLQRAGYREDDPSIDVLGRWRGRRSPAEQLGLRKFETFLYANAISIGTIRGYVYDTNLYRRWCHGEGIDPERAVQDDVLAFLVDYRMRAGEASAQRRLHAIKWHYRWLVHQGVREDNPCDGVRTRTPKFVPKPPYTHEEVRRLFAACHRVQEQAILTLLVESGLRASEITGIRREHVDFEHGVIRIFGKGSKERLIAPSERSLNLLAVCMEGRSYPWYSQRTHGPMQVDGVQRLMRRLSDRTGIKCFVHRFRTTFANNYLAQTGGDIDSLQIVMGHSKIEQTLRYAAWNRQERALARQRGLRLADSVLGPPVRLVDKGA